VLPWFVAPVIAASAARRATFHDGDLPAVVNERVRHARRALNAGCFQQFVFLVSSLPHEDCENVRTGNPLYHIQVGTREQVGIRKIPGLHVEGLVAVVVLRHDAHGQKQEQHGQ